MYDCNQAFLEATGWTREEVLAMPFKAVFPLNAADAQIYSQGVEIQAWMAAPEGLLPIRARRQVVTVRGETYTALVARVRTLREIADEGTDLEASIERLDLTAREKEVVRGIVAGRSRADLAADLFVSPETVKKHTLNLYAKLWVKTKMGLLNRLLKEPDQEARNRNGRL